MVVNEKGTFGFAISDDGNDTAYLPRSIIEKYEITMEDEGAGFSAPLKPRSERPGQYPWVAPPLLWDDDVEEADDLLGQMEDLPHLVLNIDNAINVLTFVRNEIREKVKWIEENYE